MDASISDSLSVQKYIEGNTKAYIGIHKIEPEERTSNVRLYKYNNDSYINCNCYPASKLHVEINFAIGTKQADMSARIVRDVKSFADQREEIETDCGKRKQQGVVFLQNKQELESISDMLIAIGVKNALLYGDAPQEEKAKIRARLKENENETHNASGDKEENCDHVEETTNADGTTKTEVIFANREYKYLEEANGGQFRKLLSIEEKSFFRTWEENGIRKFEFSGNVENALANINAIFDDVCEIEGKQNGATQIDNVEPGILNSQLKVEKKALIKLT